MTEKKSILRRFLPDILIALLVVTAVLFYQTRNLIPSGAVAPDFDLQLYQPNQINPARLTLKSLHGKPTVLFFWAPWCGVCKSETGMINALQKSIGDDVQIYTVATDYNSLASIERFVSENNLKAPVLLSNPETTLSYKVDTFPTTYIINADGKVMNQLVGYTSEWGIRLRLFISKFF